MYPNIHCSTIYNRQDMEQPRYPLTDEWIKKLWNIYIMEYYSAIKRDTFESVLMKWMSLEPIIQSEVSQKEKNKYRILTHITHIYGIQKDGANEPVCRAAMETQTLRTDLYIWLVGRKEKVGCMETGKQTAIYKIDSQWEFAV